VTALLLVKSFAGCQAPYDALCSKDMEKNEKNIFLILCGLNDAVRVAFSGLSSQESTMPPKKVDRLINLTKNRNG
jgi:hypothetical protein